MSIHKTFFVIVAVLSFRVPAAAAEYTPGLTKTSCSDQVQLPMSPTRVLLAHIRIDDVAATPFAWSSRQPSKIFQESASFSEEGSTLRWLYSSVAAKRIFAMYTGPQRSRPAELRIAVRLSLL
jgi:hypothetical protein